MPSRYPARKTAINRDMKFICEIKSSHYSCSRPVQGYSNVPGLPPPSGTAAAYGLVRGINQEDIYVTVDSLLAGYIDIYAFHFP